MELPLTYVLSFSALLFGIGLYGALTLNNAIRILMCIEMMLNAVNVNLIAFSRYFTPLQPTGHMFVVFVMTVAAAEVAVGLAIILMIARRRDDINVDRMNLLKW